MAEKTRRHSNAARPKKSITKVKKIIVSEGKVMFTGFSIFAGVWAFFEIVKESWDLSQVSLPWIIIAITIMRLPNVFVKMKESDDPYLIRFAKGFCDGFLGVQVIAPNISQWIISLKKFVFTFREPKEA
jgi:hypothetical protein